MNLNDIQYEARQWRERNFPNYTASDQLFGVMEEVGEIAHHFLKRQQGIRGEQAEHTREIHDGIGDLVIFLMGFCDKEGVDLTEMVRVAWDEVKQRDWVSDPRGGGL